MRTIFSLLLILALTACSSPSITSEALSDSEIAAIRERVQQMHPDLSDDQQHAVVALAVRAMDNMVPIEGGSFMMGDFGWPCEPGSDQICNIDFHQNNDHVHKVVLDDYHLSKYETTIKDFDLFRAVHGKEPYAQRIRQIEERQHYFEPNKPAMTKSWEEVRDYCLWVGDLTDTETDLPTEAQWEFAARNRGKDILYATSDGTIRQGENYPTDQERSYMEPVGSYPPNPLGLYDLNHNATEWVYDWFDEEYYQRSPVRNPQGPDKGAQKVTRGGESSNTPKYNTTVLRGHRDSELRGYTPSIGFRCGIR